MEELGTRVATIRENTTTQSTKYVYKCAIARLVTWLYGFDDGRMRSRLTTEFVEEVGAQQCDEAFVRTWLARTPFSSPVRLSELSVFDFECFISWLQSQGVNGKSTFGTMRSGLVYLFSLSGTQMDVEFAAELKLFYKGLRRSVTRSSHNLNQRLTEGKEPFSFSIYRALNNAMMRATTKDSIFAHLFLVTSWNLMCRAGNTVSIRHAHLAWREDALTIMFGHMKNDQEGDRPRDPRHLYANPIVPEVCPILALAIYGAVFGFSQDGRLFSGSRQYDRYSKALKRALASPDVNALLRASGVAVNDFGSHSARKGAATYVSSCSTAGPSASSICIRAGWSLPGIQDAYIRYEGAGDMIVGWFVAGLPFEAREFATLAPFFPRPDNVIMAAQRVAFPSAPPSLMRVCQFCLASLVYHVDYLQDQLPEDHMLRETTLFRDPDLIDQLRARVVCRSAHPTDPIRPSGIPPHIALLVALCENTKATERIVPALVEHMERLIGQQRQDAPVTRETIESAVLAALSRAGVQRQAPVIQEEVVPPTTVTQSPTQSPSQLTTPAYTWRGKLRRVPENFAFPKGNIATVWMLWCLGDQRRGYPPYRRLRPGDMSTRNKQRRLLELKRLMRLIEALLTPDQRARAVRSASAAASLLDAVKSQLPLPTHTATGQVRRLEQLSWRSFTRDLN